MLAKAIFQLSFSEEGRKHGCDARKAVLYAPKSQTVEYFILKTLAKIQSQAQKHEGKEASYGKPAEEGYESETQRAIAILKAFLVVFTDHDYLQALLAVPFRQRNMYVNAFQSLIFNRHLSERLKASAQASREGRNDAILSVIEGDLVYTCPPPSSSFHKRWVQSGDNSDVNATPTPREGWNIRIVTEEDVRKKRFSALQLVVPLLSCDCRVPQNEWGARYMQLLEQEGVTMKNTDDGDTGNVIDAGLMGGAEHKAARNGLRKKESRLYLLTNNAYRPLLGDAHDLRVRIERCKKETRAHTEEPNDIVQETEKEDEDEDQDDENSIVFSFSLGKGQYATALLRHLLGITPAE